MKIKVFANFRDICGGKSVTINLSPPQTVESVLDALIAQFPAMQEELFTEHKTLKPLVHVFVNGQNIIHLNGLETKVAANDEIALFPPVAGG
ncbi:molybdopterin synthase sulfur carrier subunit [Caldalkalibacillus uzonensis]|uniref:Molybdopterin synthase sulfur carrier subunit n=1 Tax=Caldalkalibacillus uzonensis TaxID=353224 RepID=A0ABU0CVM5_9BACI|nr:ubiquitin-like small modifier protein 1 [Caldalkalibacillus uzonensis]MDQ0340379.1 molybdopterin synthase sulfur carrier subunit [Caldalkalibacillus uzonensis]